MATKTKLEQAVEEHASTLNDAQREIVMSQLSVYKRNNARLSQIEDELRSTDYMKSTKSRQVHRTTLAYEQAQLSTANSKIASELFAFLGDR